MTTTGTTSERRSPARRAGGGVDCDIHPALPDTRALVPHLDEFWRAHVLRRGIEGEDHQLNFFPARSPLFARPDWADDTGLARADLAGVQRHVFDDLGAEAAICNVLHGAQIMFSEDLSAAMCRAVNGWIAAELLDRDPRLRASIVVPLHSPELAAEEIERRAADRRFVQVLLLAMAELPLGRRANWPIYAAAERHGLPVGIHAGSSFRHPPTALGWPSYHLEDYAVQAPGFASALTSLIAEGVFVKFPALKVVLIESGVTWLPAFMWRIDKTWRAMRAETPWLDRLPSETIRAHVRLTLTPFDDPEDPAKVETLLDQIGSDRMLLYASDYPHWHFDGTEVVPGGIPADLERRMRVENPRETYGIEVGQAAAGAG
jgi:predicted TIM-barrel fold metal-dependent hydrolase